MIENKTWTRRSFCLLAVAVIERAAAVGLQTAAPESRGYYGGFRVAIQSWCYRKFSLEEAIAKASALGLKYFELSPAHADFTRLDTAQAREIRRRLLDAGLSVHTGGVLSFRKKDRPGSLSPQKHRRNLERTFQVAQEFGLKTLLMDPERGFVKDVDRLANRYRVNAAIHNGYSEGGQHEYQSADAVSEAIRNCSPRCGAAVDTGNYLSAGQDPVAAIEKLKGRIFSVHLKDIVRPGVTCPLGQGKADIPAILKALRAQQYDNILALEYEDTPENPDPAIATSLEYLKKVTGGR